MRHSSRHASDGGRRPSHVNKQMHCGWSDAAHDGLHQRGVRPRWRHEAGGSSCFHPNLVPHDYSQFHSRWFFTETDGGSQMPKYRWERSEVGGESWGGGGVRGQPTHSTSSPGFGRRSAASVSSCRMMRHEGRRGGCVCGSSSTAVCGPSGGKGM